MKKLIPIKDYILLEKPKSNSKLIVPDTVAGMMKEEFFIASAVGKDCKEVKVGDGVVIVVKQLGKLDFEGKEILVTRETNVSMVIREIKNENI